MHLIRLAALVLAALIPCAAQPVQNIFDNTRVTDIRLELAPGQWERLKTNFLLDTYYEANLRWESMAIQKIGIRSRGNGSRIAAKPGLKLDFAQFVNGRAFLGFKSLVLDNLSQDRSMMAEFLSLQLFEKMGIPAPRSAFVRLFVNDGYAGLYTVVEPIDKLFLKRTLGEDDGYLYDYEWASEYWFQYLGPDPSLYSPLPFTPKTNEKSPDPAPLVAFIRALNESPDEDFAAAISKYIDPNQFLDYFATEVFLVDRDGMTGDWGINNFYLYRPAGGKRAIFLPWDKDVTFGLPDQTIWLRHEKNVLTRRALENPEYRDHFFRALDRCAGFAGGTGGWLDREVERVANLIRPFAAADAAKPFSMAEFEEGIEHLHRFAAERAAFVREDILR